MKRKTARPDPMLAAWKRYVAAEKAAMRAFRALDEAGAEARKNGFRGGYGSPTVEVGGYGCWTVATIRERARPNRVTGWPGLPQKEVAKLIAGLKAKQATWRRERKRAGLTPHERASERANSEYKAAIKALATTRATTLAGVLLKLAYVERGIRDGHNPSDAEVIKSAIADLKGGAS
jgi:hypothetical protein